jgi:hypothetical protein
MGVPASPSGSRASHGAASVSTADAASIPNADDVRLLHAGPGPRGGFQFSFADGVEGGIIHIIAAHLAEMMGLDTDNPLNCVQMDVTPRGKPTLLLTMQRATGKSPLRLKAEARKLLVDTLAAIESGRREPLEIMRDQIRNWLDADPASAIEARSGETTQIGSTEGESAARQGTPK